MGPESFSFPVYDGNAQKTPEETTSNPIQPDEPVVGDKESQETGKYTESIIINGNEIKVGWDMRAKEYTVYFPEMQFGEEMESYGIYDQIISIGEDRAMAEKVALSIKEDCKDDKSAYEMYKKAENIVSKISSENEDLDDSGENGETSIIESEGDTEKIKGAWMELLLPGASSGMGFNADIEINGDGKVVAFSKDIEYEGYDLDEKRNQESLQILKQAGIPYDYEFFGGDDGWILGIEAKDINKAINEGKIVFQKDEDDNFTTINPVSANIEK